MRQFKKTKKILKLQGRKNKRYIVNSFQCENITKKKAPSIIMRRKRYTTYQKGTNNHIFGFNKKQYTKIVHPKHGLKSS